MVVMGEEVVEFDFADLLGLFWFVVIGEHREVKDGGAFIGFDQDGDVADAGEQTLILDEVVRTHVNILKALLFTTNKYLPSLTTFKQSSLSSIGPMLPPINCRDIKTRTTESKAKIYRVA